MALATQCPQCFTIFRVANDQLKLRGGLVRCGSCRQVFNGNEFLVEASISDGHYQPAAGSKARFDATSSFPPLQQPLAPTDTIPEVNAAVAPVQPLAAAEPIAAVSEPKVFRSPADPGYLPDLAMPLKESEPLRADLGMDQLTPKAPEDIEAAALLRRSSTLDEKPADADPEQDSAGFGDDDPFKAYEQAAGIDPATAHDEHDEHGTASKHEQEDQDEGEEDTADEPAFVRSAQRRQRVGHVMKMAMMIAAGVMVPVLLLQSIYYWRNQLAVAVPPLQPMLNGMCAAFHCTVGLPAEIERLTLESNELQVVPPNQNIYALTLVLRNRGARAQAWPNIELTLNNDEEKAVVRRVFRPREYLPNARLADAGIGAESEQQIKLTFELNDALASGYRIYLFYP